ncbi:MAG TPA: DUF1501 domain-containing protein, partial [Fimbriimonas sp.]|nr:DUF1501 domain-containing protein [Fimbriimonas sp.]
MDPLREAEFMMTRRQLFGKATLGVGTAALNRLLGVGGIASLASWASAEQGNGIKGLPHFAPKAKYVIYLFMSGGPSQLDLWDYKPKLYDLYDKDLPDDIRNGQRFTTMTAGQARFPIAPSRFKFSKHDNGNEGVWISELLPHTATVVNELCVIKSMWTEAINHDPAVT